VKICSLYGAGFYYIPGTDVCIKIGGYLRSEVDVNAAGTFTPYLSGAQATYNRSTNNYVTRTRILPTFDVREETEYGTLRAYSRTGWQWTTGDSVSSGSGAVTYIDRAFMQFAGFTAGRAVSLYDFYETYRFSHQTQPIGSDSGGTGINLLAYTAQLGNGLSASVSAEDNASRRHGVVNGAAAGLLSPALVLNNSVVDGSANGVPTFANGTLYPDGTANIRIDQPWGSAQIMAAEHYVSASYYGATAATTFEGNGHPTDQFGWAVGTGVTLNLPMLGNGDVVSAQVNYSKGAPAYVSQNMGQAFTYNGGSVAAGFAPDAVYGAAGTSLELTTAWGFNAGYEHKWSPNWRSSLYGGYTNYSFDTAAATEMCASGFGGPVAGAAGISNCSPNWSYWQVGSRTIWNPTSNLDIGIDVVYQSVQSGFGGGTISLPAFGSKPAGNYTVANQNILAGVLRLQRNFYP